LWSHSLHRITFNLYGNKASNMVEIKRTSEGDNLAGLAKAIRGAEWGADNEQVDFSESALREIVADPNYLLLYAYVDGKVAGLTLAVRLLKPGKEHWLYIDELDTHPDFRRMGVGKALMNELFRYAKEWGLKEVWLGTEPDNDAANALYKSLKPTQVEKFIGYTFTQ
jgi:ribosomal protein S18 acetylase RimI-like enzyme